LVLCARSLALHNKARAYQKAQAEEPVANRHRMLGDGVPGVTGSDHPSATRGFNKIQKHLERLEIPQD
jgi:hypothetical protein